MQTQKHMTYCLLNKLVAVVHAKNKKKGNRSNSLILTLLKNNFPYTEVHPNAGHPSEATPMTTTSEKAIHSESSPISPFTKPKDLCAPLPTTSAQPHLQKIASH